MLGIRTLSTHCNVSLKLKIDVKFNQTTLFSSKSHDTSTQNDECKYHIPSSYSTQIVLKECTKDNQLKDNATLEGFSRFIFSIIYFEIPFFIIIYIDEIKKRSLKKWKIVVLNHNSIVPQTWNNLYQELRHIFVKKLNFYEAINFQ